MLHFFSSSNAVVNSRRAMTECIENALAQEDSLDCELIVFYTTIGHDFGDLLSQAHEISPSARLIGCTCAGVIGTRGAHESMRALGIMAIKGSENELVVSSHDNIGVANSYESAVTVGRDLKEQNPDINMILLIAPGIDLAADRLIEGIEQSFGSDVPIIGGVSSDNMKGATSFQFVGDRMYNRAVVALGLADPTLEVDTRATHGFNPCSTPIMVTRSEGNRVYELDGRPAWTELLDRLGLSETARLCDTIPIGALAMMLPAENHEEYGSSHILRVVSKKGEDNSIFLPVECKAETLLWLTERDESRIFNTLDSMVGQLVERSNGRSPVAVFHTDCGVRGRLLFNKNLKDALIGNMQVPLCRGNHVPWLGMYCLGEFAKLGSRNAFHNYTTALYPIYRCDESSLHVVK